MKKKEMHLHTVQKPDQPVQEVKHQNHLGVDGAHAHFLNPDGTLDTTNILTKSVEQDSSAGITMDPTTSSTHADTSKSEMRRPEPYEPGCWASSFACCGIVLLGGALTVACTAGVIDRFISP